MDDLIQRLRVEPTASQFLRIGDLVESLVFDDHNGDRNAALRLCALKVAAMIEEGMK